MFKLNKLLRAQPRWNERATGNISKFFTLDRKGIIHRYGLWFELRFISSHSVIQKFKLHVATAGYRMTSGGVERLMQLDRKTLKPE